LRINVINCRFLPENTSEDKNSESDLNDLNPSRKIQNQKPQKSRPEREETGYMK
jgi:hypothetical protein